MEIGRRRGERRGPKISSITSSPSVVPLVLLSPMSNANGMAGVSAALNYTNARRVTSLRLARIQRHLEKINKPAVKSIESPDGDIIDCVRRHEQPAFDHPLLKNHTIQRAPQMPAFGSGGRRAQDYNASDAAGEAWQTWHNVGHCPRGTVPIRRTTVDDVLRAKSPHHYGRKQPDAFSGNGHEVCTRT